MAEASHAVFLSYASQDAEAAQRICDALRAAGIEVWLDQSELRGGDAWDRKIRDQIRHCAIFIPIISAHSQARLEGYFRREWKFALERKRDIADELVFLLPVVIDETPERGASVPEGFHEVQWTRLPGGAVSQDFVQHVSRLLTGHPDPPKPLAQALHPSPAPAPAGSVAQSKSGSPLRMWLMLIAVVTAVIVGYIGIERYVLHKNRQVSAASAPANADKSIAVLPFVDLSGKHDQEYFGDGMAEEIINLLAKIPGLKVIGRTSSFQFKGRNEDLRTIGSKLNAAHVLEGSVRNFGDRVRITAQLINTGTGAHEWSETYDREIGDVLKLQDAIAGAVARELELTVASGFLETRSTLKSADAYDLMLRGRHAADRWDQEGLDEAVTLFKQAVDLDPTSADAAAELAYTYESQGEEGFLPPNEAFEQARRAANIALKLDGKNARAHFVLGLINMNYDWEWATAEQEFQQVATLAPGSADALIGEAALFLALGRWDDALRQIKAALAQDPVRATTFWYLAELQLRRGQLAEAEAAMRTALDIRPTYDWGHWLLGLILLARGQGQPAMLEMQRMAADDGRQSGLAMVYHALGRKPDSDASLTRMLKDRTASPYLIANVYAFRGESDQAMRSLEGAYAQKDSGLIWVKVEWPLRSLQGDARFKAFLRKMNLPEE